MSYIILDIETAAKAAADLEAIKPKFEAAGNLKDPAKIAASVAEKEAAWAEDHALHAERGRILAVGMWHGIQDEAMTMHGDDEPAMLKWAWNAINGALAGTVIVGHNLWNFDLPYLIRRSWAVGVTVPGFVLRANNRRWAPDWLHDTMLVWGGPTQDRISLDLLAWHMGVGRKSGNGADFAKLYAEDQEAALAYLRNDLTLTKGVYLRQTQAI